jgi:hypothetical protein
MKTHIFSAALVVTLLAFGHADDAAAWSADTCNSLVRGLRSDITFRLNRCTIPVGSEREEAIIYARGEWAFIAGTKLGTRMRLGSGSNSCTITLGNGTSEVAFVPTGNIDNAAGLARIRRKTCVPLGFGEVTEADVFVADYLPTGRISNASTTLGARETAIHEFGHVLGMNHNDAGMTVMCTANTCGKLAEHFYWGQLAYGAESTFPDDAHFAASVYGNAPSEGNQNLSASPWTFSDGHSRRIFNSTSTLTRCPGQTATTTVSHGSKGRLPVQQSAPFEGRIVLSTDSTIGTDDPAVSFFNLWGSTGQFFTNQFSFVVPNLSPGTYHVGFIINGNAAFSEDTYGDNALYTRRRITIPSGC